MTTTALKPFRCACGDSFFDMHELGMHHAETAHIGMWVEHPITVDGKPAKIVHDQAPLPITVPPMTLAKALEQLDAAREKLGDATLALKDAKAAEKDAQSAVNLCVDRLCDVARHESELKLPLGIDTPEDEA